MLFDLYKIGNKGILILSILLPTRSKWKKKQFIWECTHHLKSNFIFVLRNNNLCHLQSIFI